MPDDPKSKLKAPPILPNIQDTTVQRAMAQLDATARELVRRHNEHVDSIATLGSSGGRLLGIQVLGDQLGVTPTDGTYTPTAGTTAVRLKMVGAGGGGGGVGAGAGSGVGGSGNSGWFIECLIGDGDSPITGGPYSTGSPGAAGSTTPSAGGTGGDTTIIIGGVTYTAKGGTGGTAMVKTAGSGIGGGALAQSQPVPPNLVRKYYRGSGISVLVAASVAFAAAGGGTELGEGGFAIGAGNGAGGWPGGGGSGAVATSSAAGGAGGTGLIVIEEYGD